MKMPEDIFEWVLHMDLHLTEHDDRHRLMAYKAAWPHISKWLHSAAPEAERKLREIVHVAVSRALDEASVRNEVLRGMCIEVALETLPEPQSRSET